MSINATQLWLRGDTANAASSADNASATAKPQKDQDFSFWDLLDLVNPLQHIPVVSTIYRELTGDTIKPAVQIVGSAILGGPIGLITAAMSAAVTEATGQEPAQLAFNAITGGDSQTGKDTQPVAVAQNAPSNATPEIQNTNIQSAGAQTASVQNPNIQSAIAQNASTQDVAKTAAPVAGDKNAATLAAENSEQTKNNRDALMQLAADLHSTNSETPAPNAEAATKASGFVKSLQTTAPFRAVMPPPAQQFMKPGLTNSAFTGKPKVPVIDIHPLPQGVTNISSPANAMTDPASVPNAPQPVSNNQVAEQMMRALDSYQKMQTLSGSDGAMPQLSQPTTAGF